MTISLLLKAIGYTRDDIVDLFYDKDTYLIKRGRIYKQVIAERLKAKLHALISLTMKAN